MSEVARAGQPELPDVTMAWMGTRRGRGGAARRHPSSRRRAHARPARERAANDAAARLSAGAARGGAHARTGDDWERKRACRSATVRGTRATPSSTLAQATAHSFVSDAEAKNPRVLKTRNTQVVLQINHRVQLWTYEATSRQQMGILQQRSTAVLPERLRPIWLRCA